MAVLSKAALNTQNTNTIADNNQELITEAVMRSMLANIIDSMYNVADDGNPLTGGSGTIITAGQINLGGAISVDAFFTGDFVWDLFSVAGTDNTHFTQGASQLLLDARNTFTGGKSILTLAEFQLTWSNETATGGRFFALDATQAVFQQTGTATGGLTYKDDYSAGFVARSLIDKAFGDANYMSTGLGFVDISGDPSDNPLLERDLFLAEGTGLVSGGILSANAGDDTLLDISDGSGFLVDKTADPSEPRVFMEWLGGLFVGVTVPDILTQDFTSIAIENTGGGVPGVVFSSTPPSQLDKRDTIVLGTIAHPAGVISGQSHEPTPYQNLVSRVSDFLDTIGVVTKSGNIYKPGTSGLLITKTPGESFLEGGNIEFDRKIPDITQDGEDVDIPVVYFESDGGGSFELIFPAVAGLIPGFWDDLSGSLQTVGNNNWSNQRVYFQPSSGDTVIHYGQAEYANKTAALAGILSENFQASLGLEANKFAFRGFIVLRGGATDLADENDAEFRSAGKFNVSLASSGLSTKDEFSDGLFHINNSADPTKQLAFSSINITTGTTRILTVQDKSGVPALVEDIESKGTGVFNGGLITSPSSQAVTISDGNGIIVDSFTDGEVPVETPVSWSGITAEAVPTFTARQQTWIFIDSGGLILFDTNLFPAKSTFINNIFLGFIIHDNSGAGIIKDVINQPHVANNTNSLLRDHVRSTGGTKIQSGFNLGPGTIATLQLGTSDGVLFGENVNWHSDRIAANALSITGDASITMDIVISDGTVHADDVTLVDPDNYENPIGTIASIGGNDSQATIQRVYIGLDGVYKIQLGQVIYKDITEAINKIASDEALHQVWEPLDKLIFLGHVAVRKGAVDCQDVLDMVILPASEKNTGAAANPSNKLQTIPFQIPNPVSGDKILIRVQIQEPVLINEIAFLREFSGGSIDWEIRTGTDFNVTGTLVDSDNIGSGTTGEIYPVDPPVLIPANNHLWVVYPTVTGSPEFVHGEIRTTT